MFIAISVIPIVRVPRVEMPRSGVCILVDGVEGSDEVIFYHTNTEDYKKEERLKSHK